MHIQSSYPGAPAPRRPRLRVAFEVLSALLLILLFSLTSLQGQATEGTILGTITDNSGAPVAGAVVSVANVSTNQRRTTISNESGEYVVTNLPLGPYTVSAEMQGFRRVQTPGVEITIKARPRVDLRLEVGEISQAVSVNGDAPLLKTDTVEVSTVVSRQQLESLPQMSRHLLSLASLTPSISHFNGGRVGDFSGGEAISLGPLGVNSNNFMIDGISNNLELTGGMNAVPPIDAIQEFSVQTSGYAAEFGRAAGGIVNVALKSGTNQLHGFGYDYLRNDIFDARPYDFSGTNPARQPLRRNLFGGGLSGPIKKDKIFLFGNYEGLRQPQNAIEYDTVPTTLERSGDFSKSGFSIYDPATQRLDPSNGRYVRDAFPNNVIPQNRINPIGSKLISIFPTPNYKDQNPAVLSNYLAILTNNDKRDSMNLKGDVSLTASDSLTLRYSKQWLTKDRSGYMPESWIGGHATLNGTNAGATYTHIFSPSVVNEARGGWNYITDGNFNSNQTVIEELKQIPGAVVQAGYPTVSMRNLSSTKAVRPLTTLPTPYLVWQNSIQLMDNLSWHKGSHAFKFGVEYIHHRNDVGGGWAPGGVKFNFDAYQTVPYAGAKRESNRTGTPDGLLGLAGALTTYHYLDKTRMTDNRLAAFAQDDWRITRKLSLSLGLRYEWFPQWNMAKDLNTNFDLRTGKIIISDTTRDWVAANLGLANGVLPGNYEYRPRDQVQPTSTSIDLSPRVGFAYSINSRMVVRGGYGIYYSVLDALNMNNTSGAPFSFQVQRNGDTLKAIDINEGFPAANIFETLGSINIGPAQFDTRFKDPYVQKYNMNLQISPTKSTVVEVGYSGFHSIRGATSWRVNYPTPAPGDLQSRRPYPLLGEGFGIFFMNAARYNALEVSLRQREWRGLSVTTALTMSNSIGDNGSIDPYNFSYGHGRLSNDYGYNWVSSAIYNVPTPSNWNRLTKQILGGWQTATIVQLQGGAPFSVNSSQTMNDDIDSSRANLILTRGPASLGGSQRSINRWFNTDAFVSPADYTWGNSGINILRAPAFMQVDLAVQKSFRVYETARFTLRAESSNVLNQVNLGTPSATVGAAGFGTIRSLNGDPRHMQVSLRADF